MLNQAAHKWHRAGGNWCSRSSPVPIGRELRKLLRFKIFNQIDADGSGNLSFDELVQCVETLAELPDATRLNASSTMQEVRGTYPCLRVPTRDVKERELPDSQSMAKCVQAKGPTCILACCC